MARKSKEPPPPPPFFLNAYQTPVPTGRMHTAIGRARFTSKTNSMQYARAVYYRSNGHTRLAYRIRVIPKCPIPTWGR